MRIDIDKENEKVITKILKKKKRKNLTRVVFLLEMYISIYKRLLCLFLFRIVYSLKLNTYYFKEIVVVVIGVRVIGSKLGIGFVWDSLEPTTGILIVMVGKG